MNWWCFGTNSESFPNSSTSVAATNQAGNRADLSLFRFFCMVQNESVQRATVVAVRREPSHLRWGELHVDDLHHFRFCKKLAIVDSTDGCTCRRFCWTDAWDERRVPIASTRLFCQTFLSEILSAALRREKHSGFEDGGTKGGGRFDSTPLGRLIRPLAALWESAAPFSWPIVVGRQGMIGMDELLSGCRLWQFLLQPPITCP
jgi:hypothetical protein